MKSSKRFILLPLWLFRFAMLMTAYTYFYSSLIIPDFKSISWYVSLAFSIFSVLLLVGGFSKKSLFTVYSGIALFFLSVYEIFNFSSPEFMREICLFSFTAVAGLLFATHGNK